MEMIVNRSSALEVLVAAVLLTGLFYFGVRYDVQNTLRQILTWIRGLGAEPGRAPGDGDAPSPWAEFEPSMPFAIDRAILALLHAQGRECGEPCANAAHR